MRRFQGRDLSATATWSEVGLHGSGLTEVHLVVPRFKEGRGGPTTLRQLAVIHIELSSVRARVSVAWTGVGELRAERYVVREWGDHLRTRIRASAASRDAVATGQVTVGGARVAAGRADEAMLFRATSGFSSWLLG